MSEHARKLAPTPLADEAGDLVLWEIVEEHLAEAEFLLEQFDRALLSPVLTLDTLARGVEARALSHIHGLLIGGKSVRERLLDPALRDPDPNEAGITTAAAVTVASTRDLDALLPVLGHDSALLRQRAVRACVLTASDSTALWLLRRLAGNPSANERASLFEACSALGVRVSPLVQWLQSDELALVVAAAKAARHSDPTIHLPVIEYLLDHADERVREAALVASLAWGSPRAWSRCEERALDPTQVERVPMALYAALGGPSEHERLAKQLDRPSHVRAVLSALAFSGNARLLPALCEQATTGEIPIRKLGAYAIATITGLVLSSIELTAAAKAEGGQTALPAEADTEDETALPPFEDDPLDADLAPPLEDALPEPDPVALRRHTEHARKCLSPEVRWIGGKPFSLEALVTHMSGAPLGQRHALGLSLFVRTRAKAWINTHSWSSAQREQAARVADVVRSLDARRGGW